MPFAEEDSGLQNRRSYYPRVTNEVTYGKRREFGPKSAGLTYASCRMPRSPGSNPELALIASIQSRFAQRLRGVSLGIGDDCAILRPPAGHEILVTTDFSLEDRHFRRATHPAAAVGHRTLARGLSDLAAMGARPLAAFLSLALPADVPRTAKGRRWVEGFFDGLEALARSSGVPLAGGDTAQAPGSHILADIVLVGTAPSGTALRRSGAQAGDLLYVTGSLGGAAAELRTILQRKRPTRGDAGSPHLFPQPRLAVGEALRRRGLAKAAIDLSDGLSTDLAHLCQASRVRAEIDRAALPMHTLASGEPGLALHGGEDYELLFASDPSARVPRSVAGVPIMCIGRLLAEEACRPRVMLLESDGSAHALEAGGWQHFSG